MPRNVRVIQETDSGRNIRFVDRSTGERMTRAEFVQDIRSGEYHDYHVRMINGVATPASNPNRSERDNLG